MPTTPTFALPYPAAADPANVPLDLQRLAERTEAVLTPITAAVPKCGVSLAGAVGFVAATAVPVSWDTEQYDSDNMFVAGAPTRLTVRTAGLYLITATWMWNSFATGYRFHQIALNGGGVLTRDTRNAVNGDITSAVVATQAQLAVNDYVELVVYHNAGGTLANPAGGYCHLNMARISA